MPKPAWLLLLATIVVSAVVSPFYLVSLSLENGRLAERIRQLESRVDWKLIVPYNQTASAEPAQEKSLVRADAGRLSGR